MHPFYSNDPFLSWHRAWNHHWLDLPMEVCSRACEGWAVALIGLVYFVLVGQRKRTGSSWAELGSSLVLRWFPLVAALLVNGLAIRLLKDAVDSPRPLDVYGPKQLHILLSPLTHTSFPSGHSSSAALLIAYAAFQIPPTRSWLWLLPLPLLGGASRLYVGAHWALDVLVGWLVGAAMGWIAAEWTHASDRAASFHP